MFYLGYAGNTQDVNAPVQAYLGPDAFNFFTVFTKKSVRFPDFVVEFQHTVFL